MALSSVKVGPYSYPVSFLPEIINYDTKQKADAYAYVHFEPPFIHIQDGLSFERSFAVLMHEIIHAVDECMDVHLTEKQTRRLGIGLSQVLLDNDLSTFEVPDGTQA